MSNETKEKEGQQKGLRGRERMCVIIEPADSYSVTPVMAAQSK